MDNFYDYLKFGLNIFFIVVIPVIIILFRVKQKISTGFAAGMIMTSFLLSLMAVASVKEDPVKKFIRLINGGPEKSAEARAALKQVVQLGDEEFLRVDESAIKDQQGYADLKSSLASEYLELSEKVLNENRTSIVYECGSMDSLNKQLERLNHSRRLIVFAEMTGGANPGLKKEIREIISDREKKLTDLGQKCE